MKVLMKKILRALKTFVTKDVGYKILAIVFAVILWLVVVNIQNPTSTKTISNIPIEVVNEDSILDGDHVYTVKSGSTATITISGTRSVLSNLSASDFEAVADLSSLSITNAAPVTVSLKSDKSRYEGQITINQNTQSIVVDVEDVVSKELPVTITYKGDKPDDFSPDVITISPEKVTVNAPASEIDKVDSVVVKVKYEDITYGEIMDLKPYVCDADGKVIKSEFVSCNSDVINVEFKKYDSKEVSLKITPFGEPKSGYEVSKVTYSKEKVTVKADDATLAQLSEIEFPSKLLDVTNATEDVEVTIDLSEYLPDGVILQDSDSDSRAVTVTAKIEKSE